MSQVDEFINDLVSCNGYSASKMTHSLKVLGQGDMATGLNRFGGYLYSCGHSKGELTGVLKGSIGTAAVGILALMVVPRIAERIKFQNRLRRNMLLISALNQVTAKKEDPDSGLFDTINIEGVDDEGSDIIKTVIIQNKNNNEKPI